MTYESCVNENWNVWSTLVFILHHSFDFSATQDVGYINKLSQDILGCEFAAHSLLPTSDVFI